MKIQSHDAEETQSLAGRLAVAIEEHLGALPEESGVLIGLSGDLGSGKTTFVQGFVAGLAGDEDFYVTSPTFAIVQQYPTSPCITHMDLYRLESLDELEAIGYREHYFAAGVTLVEWIERVPRAVPVEWIEIRLAVTPEDVREIDFVPHGEHLKALVRKVIGAFK